ncbi:gamma-glutamyl hydrolase 2-like protein, partial [Tanacetum coccineum]
FSADLLAKLSTDRLVMHHHKYGISPQTFQENMHLSNFFKILTTSTDKDNKVYVSTVQSRRYPVTAVQCTLRVPSLLASSVISSSDSGMASFRCTSSSKTSSSKS